MAYDNPAMQQNLTPSHLEMGAADLYYLKTDLLRDHPNLLPTYFKQGGKQFTTMEMLNMFQFGKLSKAPSDSPFTGHWEKPITKNLVHVGSITAGSKASESIITLDAADMYTINNMAGQTFPKSRPRVSEVLDNGSGSLFRITAKNKAVVPNTITVESNDGTNPADSIGAGSVLNIMATVKGEFTGQVNSLQPLRYRYQNTFWITDETDTFSGTHATTAVSFNTVPGSNKLYMEGLEDAEQRHQYQKGQVWLFGKQSSNWTDFSEPLDETVPILGTQGLYDGVVTSGYNWFYDENNFEIEDIRELTSYYQSINLSTTDILLIEGIDVRRLIEDSVSDKIDYTWCIGVSDKYIINGRKEQWGADLNKDYNPEGMFLNMGVNGFVLDGYTFIQKASPEFNNEYGAGAVGDYKKTFIAAPLGYAADADRTPYIGYEYRGTDGYSRENEVWVKAGAGSGRLISGRADFVKTSQYDGVQYYLRSEIAPHFSLLNNFVIGRPNQASS